MSAWSTSPASAWPAPRPRAAFPRSVSQAAPGAAIDPLAFPAAHRRTNRHPYDRTPLPGPRAQLAGLGCVLTAPRAMARQVARASVLSWKDPRFVADLGRWTSADPQARPE